MTDIVTHGKPSREPLPDHVLFLPGRSVESTVTPYGRRGVVVDVVAIAAPATTPGKSNIFDPMYIVVWGVDGVQGAESVPGPWLRAVNPDRPRLAHDDLYAQALGRIFARRSSREDDFDGDPNRETGWREAARDALRELDAKAFEAKHAGCLYTYVVDPAGNRRPDPNDYVDGDTLICCPWYGDGPRRPNCAVHTAAWKRGERSSIFYPSESGPWRYEAPIPVDRAALYALAKATATEATAIARAGGPTVERLAGIIAANVREYAALHDGRGIHGADLYERVEAKLAETGERLDGRGAYFEAIAEAVRSGAVTFGTGPRYSPGGAS
jgi:hypothetical protein